MTLRRRRRPCGTKRPPPGCGSARSRPQSLRKRSGRSAEMQDWPGQAEPVPAYGATDSRPLQERLGQESAPKSVICISGSCTEFKVAYFSAEITACGSARSRPGVGLSRSVSGPAGVQKLQLRGPGRAGNSSASPRIRGPRPEPYQL